jgi:hypothetical protein
MIEELSQLDQLRRSGTDRVPRSGDVFVVLPATRVATPRRGGEHHRAVHPVGGHRGDGVLHGRVPVAVAEVHRQVQLGAGERSLDCGDQCAVALVDR